MISLVALFLSILYSGFIFFCLYNWLKIADVSSKPCIHNQVKVAVVVPVRNEEKNISDLLQAITNQDYPSENYRIIISDDHSTDRTIELAENFFRVRNTHNYSCIKSKGISKKHAISEAIEYTEAELIITTDADATMGNQWISSIVNEYVENKALLISGPVQLIGQDKFFDRLQTAEFAGLIGIGAAGIASGYPMICNGANLAFQRRIFTEVKGYEGSQSDSGDDTQLMLKVYHHSAGKISFLKDSRSIVKTAVQPDFISLWRQRHRWASKIPYTLSRFTVAASVIAWLFHFFLLIQFVFFTNGASILILFLPLTMKLFSEVIFLKSVSKFFDEKISTGFVFVAQPFYIIYLILIGIIAPLTKYQWKGRS